MFKPKSKFNRRNKDAAIELYLSSLKENLTKVEVPNDKLKHTQGHIPSEFHTGWPVGTPKKMAPKNKKLV